MRGRSAGKEVTVSSSRFFSSSYPSRTRQSRPGKDRMLSMPMDDREMVACFLRGETEAVGTVNGWISRAAWPYQRRLADRWDDVLQDVRLEVTRLLTEGKFRGESSLRT